MAAAVPARALPWGKSNPLGQLAQSDLVGAYGGLEDRPDLRGAMMRAARDVTRRRVDMMEYRGSQVLVEDEG